MDLQLLSQAFLATLDADLATREAAEAHLRTCRSNRDVLSACLTLSISEKYFPVIQQSAAVYLKNIVLKDWKPSTSSSSTTTTTSANGGPNTPHSISNDSSISEIAPDQKNEFRQQLVYSLHLASPEVLVHLMAIVAAIIPIDFPYNWPDLVPSTINMLQSSDSNSVYCGVLCCVQILRYFSLPSTPREQRDANLDSIVSSLFPLLYQIAAPLSMDSHEKAGLILWKILKAYKFAISLRIPSFLLQDQQVKIWLDLCINLLQRPIQSEHIPEPQESGPYTFTHKHTLSTSSSSSFTPSSPHDALPIIISGESSLQAWIKCKKWACFIHTKLMTFHATKHLSGEFNPFSPRPQSSPFATIYLYHFAPSVCSILLNEVRIWRAQPPQSVSFLSLNKSLINLYDFFDAALAVPSLWNILLPNLELLISDLVFQTLLLSDSDVEMLHLQPEEYIITNIENAEFTPRASACTFLINMIKLHQDQVLEGFFLFVNQCIAKHSENRADYQLSIQKDAALQMIRSIRSTLMNSNSPFSQQMESFMVQQVSLDTCSQHSFLRARACELISEFGKLKYSDADLQLLLMRIMDCLNDNEVVVRFQAIMTLKTLIKYPSVREALSPSITQVMHKILEIYDDVDSEQISLVMEDLIFVFAEQLSPFSVQLSEQLSNQFTRLMNELLARDQNEYGYVDDKHMAALGILNAFSTLLLSLEKSPDLLMKLEPNLMPIVKIVLENDEESFYQEVFDLIDTCLDSVTQVTDTMAQVVAMIQTGFKRNPERGAEYYMPCLCHFLQFDSANKLMTEDNIKIFFGMIMYFTSDGQFDHEDTYEACNFAQLIILKHAELGPTNLVDYYTSQLLQCCAPVLTSPSRSRGELLPVMHMCLAALFYNPAGVTQFLADRNYLAPFIEVLRTQPDVLVRPYHKKLAALASLRLLGAKYGQQPGDTTMVVGALFEIAPMCVLAYQTQVEKEAAGSTLAAAAQQPPPPGGGGGGVSFMPVQVQYGFVDETYSTEASFQQYGKFFFISFLFLLFFLLLFHTLLQLLTL